MSILTNEGESPQALQIKGLRGGVDGTWTRGLRRDRPAFWPTELRPRYPRNMVGDTRFELVTYGL